MIMLQCSEAKLKQLLEKYAESSLLITQNFAEIKKLNESISQYQIIINKLNDDLNEANNDNRTLERDLIDKENQITKLTLQMKNINIKNEQELDELNNKYGDLTDINNQLISDKEQLTNMIDELNELISILKKDLESQNSMIVTQVKEIDLLKSELDKQFKSEKDKIDNLNCEIHEYKKSINDITIQLSSLSDKYEKLTHDFGKLEIELNLVNKSNEDLKLVNNDLLKDISDYKADSARMKDDFKVLYDKYSQDNAEKDRKITESIILINNHQITINECNKTIDNYKESNKLLNNEINNLKELLFIEKSNINTLKRLHNDEKRLLSESILLLQLYISNSQNQYQSLLKNYAAIKIEIESNKSVNNNLHDYINELNRKSNNYVTEIGRLISGTQSLEREVSELTDILKQNDNLMRKQTEEIRSLSFEINNLTLTIDKLKKDKEQDLENISRLTSDYKANEILLNSEKDLSKRLNTQLQQLIQKSDTVKIEFQNFKDQNRKLLDNKNLEVNQLNNKISSLESEIRELSDKLQNNYNDIDILKDNIKQFTVSADNNGKLIEMKRVEIIKLENSILNLSKENKDKDKVISLLDRDIISYCNQIILLWDELNHLKSLYNRHKLLLINSNDEITKNRQLQKDYQNQIGKLENDLYRTKNELSIEKKLLTSRNNELTELTTQKNDLTNELKAKNNELEGLNNFISDLHLKITQYEFELKKYEDINTKLQSNITKLTDDNLLLVNENSQYHQRLKLRDNELDILNNNIKTFESNISDNIQQIKTLQITIQRNEDEHTILTEQNELLKKQLQENEEISGSKIIDLENSLKLQINAIADLRLSNDVLQQNLEKKNGDISIYENTINELNNRIFSNNKLIDKLTKEKNTLIDTNELTLSQLNQNILILKESIATKDKEINKLTDDLSQQNIDNNIKMDEINQLQGEIERLKKQLLEIKTRNSEQYTLYQNEIKVIKAENSELLLKCKEYDATKIINDAKINDLLNILKLRDEEINKLKDNVDNINRTTNLKINEYRLSHNQLNNNYQQLKKDYDNIVVLNKELSTQILLMKSEKENLSSENNSYTLKIESLTRNKIDIENKNKNLLDRNLDLQDQIRQLNNDIEYHKDQLTICVDQNTNLTKQIEDIEKNSRKSNNEKDLQMQRLNVEIQSYLINIEKLNKVVESLTNDNDELHRKIIENRKEIDDMNTTITELNRIINTTNVDFKLLKDDLVKKDNEYNKLLHQMNEYKVEKIKYESTISELNKKLVESAKYQLLVQSQDDQIISLNDQMKLLNDNILNLTVENKLINEQNNSLNDRLTIVGNVNKELLTTNDKLNIEINELNKLIGINEIEITKLKDNIFQLENDILEKKMIIKKYEDEIRILNEVILSKEREIKQLTIQIDSLNTDFNHDKLQFERLQIENKKLIDDLNIFRHKIEALQNESEISLNDKTKLIDKLNSKIQSLELEIITINNKLKIMTNDNDNIISQLSNELEKYKNLYNNICDENRTVIDQLNIKIDENNKLLNEIENLHKKMKDIESENKILILSKDNKITNLSSEIKLLQDDINRYIDQITQLSADVLNINTSLNKIKNECDNLHIKYNDANNLIKEYESKLFEKDDRLSNLNQDIIIKNQEIKKLYVDIDSLNNTIKALNIEIKYLKSENNSINSHNTNLTSLINNYRNDLHAKDVDIQNLSIQIILLYDEINILEDNLISITEKFNYIDQKLSACKVIIDLSELNKDKINDSIRRLSITKTTSIPLRKSIDKAYSQGNYDYKYAKYKDDQINDLEYLNNQLYIQLLFIFDYLRINTEHNNYFNINTNNELIESLNNQLKESVSVINDLNLFKNEQGELINSLHRQTEVYINDINNLKLINEKLSRQNELLNTEIQNKSIISDSYSNSIEYINSNSSDERNISFDRIHSIDKVNSFDGTNIKNKLENINTILSKSKLSKLFDINNNIDIKTIDPSILCTLIIENNGEIERLNNEIIHLKDNIINYENTICGNKILFSDKVKELDEIKLQNDKLKDENSFLLVQINKQIPLNNSVNNNISNYYLVLSSTDVLSTLPQRLQTLLNSQEKLESLIIESDSKSRKIVELEEIVNKKNDRIDGLHALLVNEKNDMEIIINKNENLVSVNENNSKLLNSLQLEKFKINYQIRNIIDKVNKFNNNSDLNHRSRDNLLPLFNDNYQPTSGKSKKNNSSQLRNDIIQSQKEAQNIRNINNDLILNSLNNHIFVDFLDADSVNTDYQKLYLSNSLINQLEEERFSILKHLLPNDTTKFNSIMISGESNTSTIVVNNTDRSVINEITLLDNLNFKVSSLLNDYSNLNIKYNDLENSTSIKESIVRNEESNLKIIKSNIVSVYNNLIDSIVNTPILSISIENNKFSDDANILLYISDINNHINNIFNNMDKMQLNNASFLTDMNFLSEQKINNLTKEKYNLESEVDRLLIQNQTLLTRVNELKMKNNEFAQLIGLCNTTINNLHNKVNSFIDFIPKIASDILRLNIRPEESQSFVKDQMNKLLVSN